MFPETWGGKLVASILVFVSMVYLALPMTIIVSKFNKAFEKFRPENEKKQKLKELKSLRHSENHRIAIDSHGDSIKNDFKT